MKRKGKLLFTSVFCSVLSVISGILVVDNGIFTVGNISINSYAQECSVYEERKTLIPCGTPFGIKMLTDGVIVTDFGTVNSGNECISPAELSGMKRGDVITAVNSIPVYDNKMLSDAVQLSKGICTVDIMRGKQKMTLTTKAVVSDTDGLYKLGLWTRDSCAGIGTMTFYDEESDVFGGLGHSVSDISTGLTLPLLEGEITAVTITDVLPGSDGVPGELCGAFISDHQTGTVEINSDYGVFGYSDIVPVLNTPLEIAYSNEIEKGKAFIYTTVAGMTPEEYEIEIIRIDEGSTSASRNMTIQITDKELLSITGGIVQGMSGSPIIQNGRLVGAVTHVLVNDSSMGYGIFIENMLDVSDELEIK